MKRKKRIISLFLAVSLLVSFASIGTVSAGAEKFIPKKSATSQSYSANQSSAKNYVEGEAVVLLDDSDIVSEDEKLSNSIDVSEDIEVENVEDFTGKGNDFSVATVSSDKMNTQELVEELNDSKDIVIAEPNYKYKAMDLTDDTYSKLQWALQNTGQNNGKVGNDVKPDSLWNKTTPQTREQVVAVLDTGVDYTHEDLADKMWVNPYRNKLSGKYGFDFTGTTTDGNPMDDNGHGTHCSGIIAASQNNKIGIAGVSQNTKIMGLKWLDSSGSGELDNVVAAYNYVYKAIKLGVNIVAINNSWGGTGNSKILLELINKVGKLGAVSVCAAGNETSNLDEPFYNEDYYEDNNYDEGDENYGSAADVYIPNPTNRSYPASYESDYLITVGATDEYGDIAKYSNYGKDTVDVAAPGTNILSSVSYNSFNPEIYPDIDEKTSLYITKDFNAINDSADKSENVSVKEGNTGYFSDISDDKTSLEISIKDAIPDTLYQFSIPYTAVDSEQNPYVSMMYSLVKAPKIQEKMDMFAEPSVNIIGIVDAPIDESINAFSTATASCSETEPIGTWQHITGQTKNRQAGERKLVIVFVPAEKGEYTLEVDCLGVSKGTKNEEESFGKYDIRSGTSMAAPVITGEAALLKEKYPDLSAEEVVDKIVGACSQSEKYDYAVKTSGVSDLSRLDNPVPVIDSVTNSKDGTITIKGDNLKDAKIKINGNDVAVKNSDDNTITSDVVSVNGLADIEVTNSNGYCKKETILINGTKYSKSLTPMDYYLRDYTFASDGKYMYIVGDDGSINSYNTKGSLVTSYTNNLDSHFKDTIGYVEHDYDIRNVLYSNGNLYFLATLNLYSSSISFIETDEENTKSSPFYTESVIVKFNIAGEKYSYINFNDDLTGASIGMLNGNLYLIGGYSYKNSNLTTGVYKYSSGKWVEDSTLPSARAFGKCIQVNNNQMVYTLGTDGSADVPKNLIFDGKTWTESKVSLKSESYNTAQIDDKEFVYYNGGVDLISGGLLYTGVLYDGYGDTVKYTVSTDSYSHLNNYYMTKPTDIIRGVVINDKFIGTACELYSSSEVDEYTGELEEYVDYASIGYSFAVTSGMYKITGNASHGKLTGTGVYYPGDTVTVKASANSGYKVKSITLNGKTYKNTSVSFKATKSTTVKVNYTPVVKSIKMSAAKKTLKKGKSFKLTAKITATKGASKALSWKNSKSKVAKMKKINNKTVKITAKKKGSTVITATAKDGSKKSAKCKVKVK